MSESKKTIPFSGIGERFRQTRYVNDQGKMSVRIESAQAALKNWSRTGLGFELPAGSPRFDGGTCIPALSVWVDDEEIFTGAVKVQHRLDLPDGNTYYGVSFESKLFPVDAVQSFGFLSTLKLELESARRDYSEIRPDIALKVAMVSSGLRRLRDICEELESQWKGMTYDSRREVEEIILPKLGNYVKNIFNKFNADIGNSLDVLSLPPESPYFAFFQEFIYQPYASEGSFPRRAFEKPRGYAGDFEMMNQIYRNEFEGGTLFSRIIHYWVTNENSSDSVRYRRGYFFHHFESLRKQDVLSVLSVASGPAIEIQDFIENAPQEELNRFHFTLFDLDRGALEHAQTKLYTIAAKQNKSVSLDFVNASVKAFLSNVVSAARKFDFIYSAGLFDYLDNKTSMALVRQLSSFLAPKGKMVIGNFTRANLSKAFCHLALNWVLIHKDEEELRQWARELESCDLSIEYDERRMNAFVVITRR